LFRPKLGLVHPVDLRGRHSGVSESVDSGKAELAIPLKGPKGTATVFVVASKSQGQWHYSKLIVQIEGPFPTIDLSDPPTNAKDNAGLGVAKERL
jgi:hypothetical protein